MAKNIVRKEGNAVYLNINVGAGVSSGDVVAVGQLVGVAVTDADSNNYATVAFPVAFTARLDVTGADAAGNSAVVVGDVLYKDGTQVNKDATNGIPLGFALETVAAGATTEIEVAMAALK